MVDFVEKALAKKCFLDYSSFEPLMLSNKQKEPPKQFKNK